MHRFCSGNGRLAQLVQSICLTSRGSAVRIRQRPQIKNPFPCACKHLGRLAQLVQSICLTSRGSAVRIRQRPQIKTAIEFRLPFLLYVECRSVLFFAKICFVVQFFFRCDLFVFYSEKPISRTNCFITSTLTVDAFSLSYIKQ